MPKYFLKAFEKASWSLYPTAFATEAMDKSVFFNRELALSILIGRKGNDPEEKCGYYGEKIVLYAQTLGLNTCWVALTYSKVKSAFQIDPGEKLCLVIAIGYGQTQGISRNSKPREKVMNTEASLPDWFLRGIDAALLAPTAMNQQKFTFTCKENQVSGKAGLGFYSKIDLGIVKYHFELGAGKENFRWV